MSSIILATDSQHPAVDQWNAIYNDLCPQYGVEPNLCKGHVEFESDGNATIVGESGRGLGLGQLDYGTYQDSAGKWYYSSVHGVTDQVFDPETNIKIMCRDFLAPLKAAFGDNVNARIAGYNCGIEAVETALAAGVDLTTITTDPAYIRNVLRAWQWYDSLSQQAAR